MLRERTNPSHGPPPRAHQSWAPRKPPQTRQTQAGCLLGICTFPPSPSSESLFSNLDEVSMSSFSTSKCATCPGARMRPCLLPHLRVTRSFILLLYLKHACMYVVSTCHAVFCRDSTQQGQVERRGLWAGLAPYLTIPSTYLLLAVELIACVLAAMEIREHKSHSQAFPETALRSVRSPPCVHHRAAVMGEAGRCPACGQ